MLAVVFLLTAAVLVVVQARMRRHVREDLVSTLRAESAVYTGLVRVRREQTQQSTAMIADQPSLKALMSTDEVKTHNKGLASTTERVVMKAGTYPRLWKSQAKKKDVPKASPSN